MNFPSVQTFEGFLIPMLTTAYHMNLRFLTTEVRGGRKKGGKLKIMSEHRKFNSILEKKPCKNKMRI